MSNKFQIEIPKPCHESWNNMTPAEQGRFCGSCQKTVVDFTGMSDAQLAAFFKKSSTGSVCGRFDDDQLQRDFSVPRKRMPWLKYFLQLLVPTFLLACKAKSQGEPRIIHDTVQMDTKKDIKENIIEHKKSTRKIQGKVVDERGVAVPFAVIKIKGTDRGTSSDENGKFEITITNAQSKVRLEFSAIGYATLEVPLRKIKDDENFILRLHTMVLGEIAIINSYKRERDQNI